MPSTPNSGRILVVDDEEVIRELISSMLTSAGYQCVPASSGYEAESLLSSGEDFELMLSGPVELDEMVSFERLEERFPDMPLVVVVTATENIAAVLAYVFKARAAVIQSVWLRSIVRGSRHLTVELSGTDALQDQPRWRTQHGRCEATPPNALRNLLDGGDTHVFLRFP